VEYNVGYAPDDIGYLGMAKRVEIPPKEGYRPVRATPKRLKARYISRREALALRAKASGSGECILSLIFIGGSRLALFSLC
jgi:hypothetical protein